MQTRHTAFLTHSPPTPQQFRIILFYRPLAHCRGKADCTWENVYYGKSLKHMGATTLFVRSCISALKFLSPDNTLIIQLAITSWSIVTSMQEFLNCCTCSSSCSFCARSSASSFCISLSMTTWSVCSFSLSSCWLRMRPFSWSSATTTATWYFKSATHTPVFYSPLPPPTIGKGQNLHHTSNPKIHMTHSGKWGNKV